MELTMTMEVDTVVFVGGRDCVFVDKEGRLCVQR